MAEPMSYAVHVPPQIGLASIVEILACSSGTVDLMAKLNRRFFEINARTVRRWKEHTDHRIISQTPTQPPRHNPQETVTSAHPSHTTQPTRDGHKRPPNPREAMTSAHTKDTHDVRLMRRIASRIDVLGQRARRYELRAAVHARVNLRDTSKRNSFTRGSMQQEHCRSARNGPLVDPVTTLRLRYGIYERQRASTECPQNMLQRSIGCLQNETRGPGKNGGRYFKQYTRFGYQRRFCDHPYFDSGTHPNGVFLLSLASFAKVFI